MNWHEVTSLENLKIKGRKLFRLGPAQIAVFMVGERVYAIDNRCPHEGYPLMQGDIDSARCTLTCHWHNWKFDLQQGDALVGQDAVRTYPTRVVEGKVEIDLRPADPEKLKLERLKALQAAFNERQYGRVARELARMHYQGLDPLDALRAAITWASPLLEFGSTHAHAAMADWLTLANEAETPQQRLIPLLESFDHLALDVLGKGEYPYPQGEKAFSEQALLAAIEAEDEAEAMMLLRGAWAQGLGFAQLLPVLTQAALAHHLDFGHSLIYVQKSAELIETLGKEVEAPLTLSLLRAILQATREDLLPAFKDYAPALEKLQAQGFGSSASPPDFEPLLGTSVKKAFAWVLAQAGEHRPEALYATLLQALAHNLLHFDERHQWAREVTVDDNVGWLDATHGLTFANAVHTLCRRLPELWPAALLQLALFYGRNIAYLDLDQRPRADEPASESFWERVIEQLYDHGVGQPIFASHHLKTALAVRAECRELDERSQKLLRNALWRFLKAPLKQKHVWRTMYQSLALVGKDYGEVQS